MALTIPVNAKQLLREAIERADALLVECSSIYDLVDRSLTTAESLMDQLRDEASLFLKYLRLFPYRWVGRSPTERGCLRADNLLGPSFVLDGDEKDPSFQFDWWDIPDDLCCLFIEIQQAHKWSKEDGAEYLRRIEKLCRMAIFHFKAVMDYVSVIEENKAGPTHGLGADPPTKHELRDSNRTLVCPKGRFTFTKSQAPVIRIFFENFKRGNQFLREQDVLEDETVSMSRSSFRDVFKSRWDEFKCITERHEKEKDLWRFNLG